jgi:pimeloyl-ACP methyl ester carboxylesterase
MKIKFEFIDTNGIRLHTIQAGPPDGDPVILLHGFPEAWFGWEKQILALAKAGFRVFAPDQRGYNLSTKPVGADKYQTKYLVKDIIGLARSLDLDSFYLAGHDWGAIIAWSLAMVAPRRIKRLAIANVPHPAVFSSYLRTHPSQMIKSWYAMFFQLPWIPERFVKARNWKFMINAMPKYWDEDQRDRYREAWGQPGAITAMINWYRSAFGRSSTQNTNKQIEPETLIIWGKQDPHLSWQMAEPSLEYCRDGRLVFFEDASHWVQHDKAEEVSQLLIDHFSGKEIHGN